MIMGLFGIVIALVLLIWMVYKGWPVLVAAAVAAVMVSLTNQISITAGYSNIYMGDVGSFVVGNLPIYLWGAIFGQMYHVSGAASSIAQRISKLLKGKKENIGASTGILIIFSAGVLMSYGGISGIVLMFVMMPLGLEILKECNVPRHMAPGILLGSMATAALSMPGSPQIQNASPMTFLGTSSTAALIPGIIGGIVVLVMNYFYLTYAAKKEIAGGAGFEVIAGEKISMDKGFGTAVEDMKEERRKVAEWFYNSPKICGIQGEFQWVGGKKIPSVYYFQFTENGLQVVK